ncbi:MAG: caspase family protein, partial [Myxococcota bacterium]
MSEISSIDTTRAGACRALLIGSDPDRDLPGVHEDVMAMASALDQLGWDDIRLCHEHRATRRNILRAVDALIARTEPGDAVVVYYAGHGSRARAVSAGQRSGRPLPAFIVPMDIDHSSAEDFRGISDLELSLELARLTARTRNVTVIMDCCHSGRVVRGPRGMRDAGPVRVRFRPDCSIGIDRHLAALRRERDTSAIEGRQSDPHAIRILACEPSEQALEVYEDGRPGGVLTRELIRILTGRSAGTATWRLVASVLREAVRSRVPSGHWQTPQIEGPIDRVPFETRRESSGHLASTYRPDHRRDELRLRGGYLLDMQRGDRYQVRPLPHQRGRGVVYRDGRPATPAHPVEVEVTRVGAGYAVVTSDRGEDADVPAGAPAFLIARSSPGRPVVVRAAGQQRDPARAGLRAAIGRSIERSLFVRVADPAADGATDDVGGDAADDVADDNSRVGTDADPVLATVTVGDDLIELRDGQGVVREWREPGAAIDE